jgi:hypothetical protein
LVTLGLYGPELKLPKKCFLDLHCQIFIKFQEEFPPVLSRRKQALSESVFHMLSSSSRRIIYCIPQLCVQAYPFTKSG